MVRFVARVTTFYQEIVSKVHDGTISAVGGGYLLAGAGSCMIWGGNSCVTETVETASLLWGGRLRAVSC